VYLQVLKKGSGKASLVFFCLIFFYSSHLCAQADSSKTTLHNRKKLVSIGTIGLYSSSIIALNQLWYKDYQRTKFHLFDDNGEWKQVDKVGHSYSTYILSKVSAKSFKWAGYNQKEAELLGSGGAFLYLGAIEMMDAHSKKWGFSWGDFTANTIGNALYLGQELWLEKQIVKLKFSYSPTQFREMRPSLLGNNELQAVFKDYNGQTYWASMNLNSINGAIKPKWLNFSLGYGAGGMVQATDSRMGNQYREYYLSADIDLEKIETQKKWLKTALSLLNTIKIPFPAFEFSPDRKSQFHWIYF
jgi:hypothetical protein